MGFFSKAKKKLKKAFKSVKKVFKKIVTSKIFWAVVIVVVAIYAPQIAAWAKGLAAPAASTAAAGSAPISAAAGAASATAPVASAGVVGSAQTAALTTTAGAASGAGTALAAVPGAAGAGGFSLANIGANLGKVATWVGANQWSVPVMTQAIGAGLTASADADRLKAEEKHREGNVDGGSFGGRQDFSNKNLPDFRGTRESVTDRLDRGDRTDPARTSDRMERSNV